MDSCDYINASFIDVRTHMIEHNIPSFVNAILRVMVGEPMPMLQHKVCMTVNIDISDTYTISGPVEVSVERFWRMVWENQIPTIVMLTQCTEAGKVSMILQYVCR